MITAKTNCDEVSAPLEVNCEYLLAFIRQNFIPRRATATIFGRYCYDWKALFMMPKIINLYLSEKKLQGYLFILQFFNLNFIVPVFWQSRMAIFDHAGQFKFLGYNDFW
jgi:hypothetical protein